MKQRCKRWAMCGALIVFYVFLVALILNLTMAKVFPDFTYWDYLLPSFGLLFVSAAGDDIARLKYYGERVDRENRNL